MCDDSRARQLEQLRERRPGRSLHGITRLHPAKNEVSALGPHDVGKGPRDRERVMADVLDPDCAVGAHREAASQRRLGLLRATRDEDDFAAEALPQLERLLGREAIPFVQRRVEIVRVDVEPVSGELDLVPELQHLLYTHDGFHYDSDASA